VCDAHPYIFGVGLTDDADDGTPTPLSGIYAKLGALHPNPDGVSFLAQQVIAAIQAHPDFADAEPVPVLPATGPQPAALAGIAAALLGVGLLALRRRGSRPADQR
jgi:LPXTG-motif cell wall-anchored protein